MTIPPQEEIVGRQFSMDYLGIGPTKWWEIFTRDKKIPSFRVGKKIRIYKEDLDTYLEDHPNPGQQYFKDTK